MQGNCAQVHVFHFSESHSAEDLPIQHDLRRILLFEPFPELFRILPDQKHVRFIVYDRPLISGLNSQVDDTVYFNAALVFRSNQVAAKLTDSLIRELFPELERKLRISLAGLQHHRQRGRFRQLRRHASLLWSQPLGRQLVR